jgi:hypothetical protein
LERRADARVGREVVKCGRATKLCFADGGVV